MLARPSPQARSAGEVIDHATEALQVFDRQRSQLEMPQDAEAIRELSRPAFEQAQQAMDAMQRLTDGQRLVAHRHRIPQFLEQTRARAAYGMIVTQSKLPREAALDREMSEVEARRLGLPGQKQAWKRFTQGVDEDAKSLRPYLQALKQTHKNYSRDETAGIQNRELVRDMADAGIHHAEAFPGSVYQGQIIACLAMLTGPEVFGPENPNAMDTHREIGAILTLIEKPVAHGDGPDVPLRQLQQLAQLEFHAQQYMAAVLRSLPAGQDLADTLPGFASLELAESIRRALVFFSVQPKVREAAAAMDRMQELEAAPGASRGAAAAIEDRRVPAQQQAARSRRAPASDGAGPLAETSGRASGVGPARSAPPRSVHGQAVVELASERLRQFPAPPPPRAGARFDLVSLGKSMGRDTAHLRAALEDGLDPLTAATWMRSAVVHWFGAPDVWSQRSAQLQSLPGPDKDADVQALREKIDARIQGIQALQGHIDVAERDLLKQYPFPRAPHLTRLLELGEAAPRGAARRLASDGDTADGRGLLFEVRVDLEPLSDGRAAAPLYVHFHARQPVAAADIRTIRHEHLDAIHVKTAEQVNWGARWVRLNQALLGAVHRGPLTASALARLQARMS
ncbi:hypothetical protein [Paracidovorax avenae]|uniref:hypothetical protein n=2 Tax=Paracidovorax avenae TaxID=80867 RepID=UPI000D22A9ED|nr:hypothetical protein [Paracidovorax avenae]AVT01421.1 hypothetical protein C8243_02145 [Paracidovorax avenae]